jgi:osmotically-inducible protein OsmY
MPDYNRNRDSESYQQPNREWERYGNEYDQMRNQGDHFSDRRNEGRAYGDVYHGNVEQRERETNRAAGNRYYGNRENINREYGPHQYGRDYEQDRYRAANSGYGQSDENRGFGSAGNEFSSDYGRPHNNESRNRYGGDTRNYGNANQGSFDRDWWDRTKDEVSSWFGGGRNEEGPHRGKGPKGYQRSEQRIKEDVCERLSEDPYVDASNIEIDIQNNEVVLSGSIDSKEAKRRVEDIVESVSGVSNVQNHLRVTQWTPAHTTATIASDIERTTRNNQF